jgi:hypothetical protein
MLASAQPFTNNGFGPRSKRAITARSWQLTSTGGELAEDTLTAAERLLARCPDAQIWFVRIGHRGVHRFGFQRAAEVA